MIHMIGNAHLDPVWLWTKQEGFCEVLSTFESAARRIEEDENFIFTCSAAAYYEFVKANNPALFEKIKKYVEQKRWIVVGGWYIQPDCNLLAGEVYARHALYSQSFFKQEFGLTCETGYCVDSFGHSAAVPQLLMQSGMKNYVFMRPGLHEKPELPPLFYWTAADGSRVLCYRITEQNYNNSGSTLAVDLAVNEKNSEKFGHDMMCFYGVGNHGGGPTRQHLKEINGYIEGGRDIRYGDPDEFFKSVRAKKKLKLHEHKGDLQHHAIGCYSAANFIKTLERRAEAELAKSEKYMLLSNRLLGTFYDAESIHEAYKSVLFNNFHDVYCGCALERALYEAADFYHGAIAAAKRIKEQCLINISKGIDTMTDGVTLCGKEDWQIWEEPNLGVPLVLFNPHSYPVKKPVRVDRVFASCVDSSGKALPLQYVQSDCMNGLEHLATVLEAEIPAYGYTTYWLYKENKLTAPPPTPDIAVSADTLENEFIKVKFDADDGSIRSLTDKGSGAELLSQKSMIPRIYRDRSDTWSHGDKAEYDLSEFQSMTCVSAKTVDKGPLVGSIRVKYEHNHSYVFVTYSLFHGEKKLRADVKCNYREDDSIMRFHFFANFAETLADYEVPYGFVTKRSLGHEQPALRYAAVKQKEGSLALGIATQNKSSFRVKDGDISFVAARNCIFANHGGFIDDDTLYNYIDEGVQHFAFEILPFASGVDHGELTRCADLLATDADYLIDTYHSGELKRTYCGIDIDCANVVLTCAKYSEDGAAIILRLYETEQCETVCSVKYGGNTFDLHFHKNEVKTLRIEKDGTSRSVNFMEE